MKCKRLRINYLSIIVRYYQKDNKYQKAKEKELSETENTNLLRV